jgi:hypothetical protein
LSAKRIGAVEAVGKLLILPRSALLAPFLFRSFRPQDETLVLFLVNSECLFRFLPIDRRRAAASNGAIAESN